MRLIDADALIGAIRHDADQTPDSNWGYGLNHAVVIVRNQPTVDAIQVVRCLDCKWYDEKISFCDNCHLPREQTFFCADGKRRGKAVKLE